jgi:hypothetical protein
MVVNASASMGISSGLELNATVCETRDGTSRESRRPSCRGAAAPTTTSDGTEAAPQYITGSTPIATQDRVGTLGRVSVHE